VLYAESPEDLDGTVVHPDRDAYVVLPEVVTQQFLRALIEIENFGDPVELGLGHFEGIERFLGHGLTLLQKMVKDTGMIIFYPVIVKIYRID
jgi:hypothetical protein